MVATRDEIVNVNKYLIVLLIVTYIIWRFTGSYNVSLIYYMIFGGLIGWNVVGSYYGNVDYNQLFVIVLLLIFFNSQDMLAHRGVCN